MANDDAAAHPNLPRRGPLALMFAAIVVCGALGGSIGYGLVHTSCAAEPTVAEHLLETVPGYHVHERSCDLKLLGGALAGTVLAAVGAGIVAILMMRAQAEWRAHPAGRPMAQSAGAARPAGGRGPPVRKPRSGGTPPRT